MSILDVAELEALWILQGGKISAAPMAAAIAMAESRGNSNNAAPGMIGLWNINGAAHPGLAGEAASSDQGNAKAAIAISDNGTNWGPWKSYTNGSYAQFLPAAKKVFGAVKANLKSFEAKPNPNAGFGLPFGDFGLNWTAGQFQQGFNNIAQAASWTVELGKFLAALTDPKHLLRIILVIVGGLFVLIALYSFISKGH